MKKHTLQRSLVLWGLLACSSLVSAQNTVTEPRGGWRYSTQSEGFTQSVNYPANSVNVAPGQLAAIKGRIDRAVMQTVKATNRQGEQANAIAPATLIVNGAAMPLSIQEDGSFERPYAFGRGSNSLQIKSTDGKSLKKVQFYEANPLKPNSKLRVILSWDSDGTDLDLHVVSPSGQHCFYGNRVVKGGGALDVDVTTGYGPEIFATPAPENGNYMVFVNYYGSGQNTQELTVANVTIITHENTPNERQQTMRIPMRKAGELTMVRSFVFP